MINTNLELILVLIESLHFYQSMKTKEKFMIQNRNLHNILIVQESKQLKYRDHTLKDLKHCMPSLVKYFSLKCPQRICSDWIIGKQTSRMFLLSSFSLQFNREHRNLNCLCPSPKRISHIHVPRIWSSVFFTGTASFLVWLLCKLVCIRMEEFQNIHRIQML